MIKSFRFLVILMFLGASLLVLCPHLAFAAVSGSFLLNQDEFISEDFEATDRRSFSYFGAHLVSTEPDKSKVGLRADAEGEFAAGAPAMNYLNVAELYWQDGGFSVGRKKEEWSKLDRTWKMGLFEPLFKQNPLDPEVQGLTGLFLDVGNENWGVKMFASFLFIPDQGAGYELKNGSFEKANPWFQRPPSYIQFFGQTDRINYDIEKPQTNDIIYNRSYVGAIHFGHLEKGYFFQIALASKPANQLAFGFDGFLKTDKTVQVQVTPKVFYHNLASGELSYNSKYVGLGLTGVTENPKAPEFSDKLIYAQYRPSSIISPYIEAKYIGWRALLSYLKVQGGEAEAKGDTGANAFGSTQNSILADRYPFREAGLLRFSTVQKLSKKRALDFETQYVRGSGEEFSMLSFEAGYRWDAYWKTSLKSQLVAAGDSIEAQKTVAGQFQNNDSLSLGVSYVF